MLCETFLILNIFSSHLKHTVHFLSFYLLLKKCRIKNIQNKNIVLTHTWHMLHEGIKASCKLQYVADPLLGFIYFFGEDGTGLYA